jgi:Na+/melibiose symporter-like transporter
MAELISVEDLNDQLQLKPRFKLEVSDLSIAENSTIKAKQLNDKQIKFKRLDEHIWISIIGETKRYYSPRLHVEVEQKATTAILHCTFGPDPNLWTLFMFFHFFLGLSFIGLLTWFYTNLSLEQSNALVYSLLLTVALLWIGLYVFARQNRQKAAPQSQAIIRILKQVIT